MSIGASPRSARVGTGGSGLRRSVTPGAAVSLLLAGTAVVVAGSGTWAGAASPPALHRATPAAHPSIVAPTISSVAPKTGPSTGGTRVTITGTDFTGVTEVSFGTVPATNSQIVATGTTKLSVVTPAHTPGTVNVSITTTHGDATDTGAFTYFAPKPTIGSLSPSSGATTGGTSVTIRGAHLTASTSVTFGATPAPTFQVTGTTKLVVKTPTHAAGKVAVTVDTTHGTATKATAFTFLLPAPTISSVTPESGPTAGGTVVTVRGTHLTGASRVTFGTVAATTLHVSSATALTARTPAHGAGAVTVAVTAPGGTGAGPGAFTFLAPARFTAPPPPKTPGYDLVGSDGGVFVFPLGQASGFFGSLPGLTPPVHVNNIVGIVPTNDYTGYDLVGSDGGVFVFPLGQPSGFFGSLPGEGFHVGNIVGIAVTGDDRGYWLAGSTGHVYSLGDAPPVASPSTSAPIVGIAADASSQGGWLVAKNGSVYAFGDAASFGTLPQEGTSVGNIVSIVPTPSGNGYWVIGADGRVFAFGDAASQGTLPSLGVGVSNVVGAVPTG
ncbi:MAG: IPT/TIG domain-containing protein [Acidimicrobiales bacterium]